MLESQNKTKQLISDIVSPFATASMALLVLLSLLEYFRRGFVSLFIDLRVLAGSALALWLVAVLTELPPRRRRAALILPTLALLAALPVLYRMTLPFGRLGLVTLIAGVFAILIIIIAITISVKQSMNDEQ